MLYLVLLAPLAGMALLVAMSTIERWQEKSIEVGTDDAGSALRPDRSR